MIKLNINNLEVEVPEGTMVLEAARKAGVKIPTLCHLEGKSPLGACRVCLCEIEGGRALAASCATPATDGMKVFTNTKRVRDARRTVVDLLLSEHNGNCQTCERNNDCELQELARELGIEEVKYQGQQLEATKDFTTAALVRDNGKCIKCRRCVTVCNQVQRVGALFPQGRGFDTVIGPAFTLGLDEVACVQCGQCAAVCPVGAISEKSSIDKVWEALDDPNKIVLVQTAPAIRSALGESFGMEAGKAVTGKMVSALKQLGFYRVFDTNFTADLTIMEEGTELLTRLKKALVDKEEVALPQYTSCCPGWIKYAEYNDHDILPNLSTCKSPQQMFGAVAKTYFTQNIAADIEDVVVVSVMPCTAKKYECDRPEMNNSGMQDVDYVLTTRELAKMIKQSGINFKDLPDSKMDAPLGLSSGAADIFANSGGVMEAAIRTAYEIVTGRELPLENLKVEAIAGLEGIKKASLKIEGCVPDWSFLEGVDLKVGVAHGLANARKIIDASKAGEEFHFVEVMTCPGGCIGGGGQPRFTDDTIRAKRIQAICNEDEGKELRKSHENADIQVLYEKFLGVPCGHMSHDLLHTHYTAREKVK